MFEFLKYFNLGCGLLLTVLYLHHVVYMFLGFFLHFKKDKRNNEVEKNKVAILIPARNEEVVIANLINSLKLQDYPKEFYDIYVIADNCTDNTKQVALDNGVFAIERFNKTYIGKGFALDYAIKYIKNQIKKNYDAYLVFDADNVVSLDFLSNINNEFTKGYDVVTSYRAPKNYGDNWIAAVSGLAYVRESILLQRPRSALNVNCSISGTGFLVSADVLKNGWPYHLLTEDIELSCDMSIKKYKIGYASDAVTFDEQPNKIRVFFKQRLRWSKGFLQVFRRYGFKLFKKSFKSFSAYEMFSFTLPVPGFFIFSQLVNLGFVITGAAIGRQDVVNAGAWYLLAGIVSTYIFAFINGLVATILEWKRLNAKWYKKIWYVFCYPMIVFLYLITFIKALFKKEVIWEQIEHSSDKTIEEVNL